MWKGAEKGIIIRRRCGCEGGLFGDERYMKCVDANENGALKVKTVGVGQSDENRSEGRLEAT